uniref:Endolysin n=1 Tax=Pseudomonas phage Pavpe01 TaxID=3138545 RepID=A0AAU6W0R5_9VIRU
MTTTPSQLKTKIDAVMRAEGWDKYTDLPNDKGGPTKWGITEVTARAFGYTGAMQDLDYDTAYAIYRERFWLAPKFDQIDSRSEYLSNTLFDYGVNSGPSRPVKALQRALNALNRRETDYPDIDTDGGLGRITFACLDSFIKKRGPDGLNYLTEMVKAQRSVFLLETSERNQTQEDFQNGWQQRVFK